MTEPHTARVYSTTDPTIVTAYRATAAAFAEVGRRAREDAAALGNNTGPLIVNSRVSAPEVVGLATDTPDAPPAGWRYSKTDEHLVPRRGKPGEAARQWLADHQPPDMRAVMELHGLPRTAKPGDDFRWFLATPGLFEHDGTVWAMYLNEPDGDCRWERRKVSEWHAAREAMEAAQKPAEVPA
ncbi:hypothetical protein QTQ03_16515 [Micromonospora sp. WMMA1363]|uniref:hypothetical protein n=1 Tax=Micromonospora sp. WMMA1363 TaxID=3053985 RepID=UPI00259D2561|nr:hypothetical protein [Micromonospora sp. WMMA1363]MDM4721122.1 hypothetical protein [Micromonospora sp. WMMA1363]